MKFFSAVMAAVMVLATQTLFTVDAQAASKPKPLPAKVAANLKKSLDSLTDFNDPKAVTAAVMNAIKASPSFAPEIVAFATQYIGSKLASSPAIAAAVIPAFVKAAAQNQPQFASEIVTQAIGALPPSLQVAVVPAIASEVIAGTESKKGKAEILNAALEASAGNATVQAALDKVATANQINIVTGDQANNTQQTRYFVDDQGFGDFTGDQGTSTLGSFNGGGASGGGGNPSNSGNTPTPAS